MRPIHPNLFARLMRLPHHARTDLLEFLGATPIADAQLSVMIEDIAAKVERGLRSPRYETN
ncbi:MAG: hypothetical protein ACRCSU_17095 [Paracoccaceae bacterium]